jgi:hypothetical protein
MKSGGDGRASYGCKRDGDSDQNQTVKSTLHNCERYGRRDQKKSDLALCKVVA